MIQITEVNTRSGIEGGALTASRRPPGRPQYHGVGRLGRKNLPRSQVPNFEIRECDLTASTLDRLEAAHRRASQRAPVEANALVVTKEVRRSVQAHPVSGGEQNPSSIAQVEPLPLVPATVKNTAELDLPSTSRTSPRFQPELDGLRMDVLDVVEPLSEVPAGHETANRISLPGEPAAAGA